MKQLSFKQTLSKAISRSSETVRDILFAFIVYSVYMVKTCAILQLSFQNNI